MTHKYTARFLNLLKDGLYEFRLAASKFFPKYIRRPYPRIRLQDWRQFDADQNARSAPPEDENIDLCSAWAIEFYTPAHMNHLLNGLEHLGWTEDESRNPVAWLKDWGTSQFGQSWMPLERVIPRGVPDPYITGSLRAELPPNVKYAYGDIYCFTPSLIAIVFEFVFDKEYSQILDNALRQDRISQVTATKWGSRIHDPSNQKIAHVKKIREDTARLVAAWFSKNLPGLCSAGLLQGEFPTCEFVTFRKAKPFPLRGELAAEPLSYLWHLGLSHSYGSWESTGMPDLRFEPSARDRNIPRFHSVLSIDEASWVKQDSQQGNGSDRDSRIYSMHRKVSGMLGIWAIGVLLQGYAQHFRELRNSEFLRSTKESAVQALQRIAESVSFSVDIAAVTAELASYVSKRRPLGIEVESFRPRSDALDSWWKGSLEDLIQTQIGENANWLLSVDTAVRDHLTQYGTILGMVEDIRLQKKITLLTYAMLGLTIVLATLTFITAIDRFQWVRAMLNSLGDIFQLSKLF